MSSELEAARLLEDLVAALRAGGVGLRAQGDRCRKLAATLDGLATAAETGAPAGEALEEVFSQIQLFAAEVPGAVDPLRRVAEVLRKMRQQRSHLEAAERN